MIDSSGAGFDLASHPWLPYVVMPFIVAFVGWFTNWLGVKMMFYPAEFKGIGPIGWQGIVPRIRGKLTRDITRITVKQMCSPQDMIEALDQADAINKLAVAMDPLIEDIVDEFMVENGAKYWPMALRQIRMPAYNAVRKQMPKLARGMLDDIKERADRLIDIEELAAQGAVEKPGALTDLVNTIYKKEFNFIVYSGIYIGFPLGCIQAALWYVTPMDWLLPVFGAFVGGATNWIALQVLVHPTEPKKIFGRTWQGVMIARQQEVAGMFAEQFTTGFMDAEAFIKHVWEGPQKEEIQALMQKRFRRHMDSSVITKTFDNALRMAAKGDNFDESVVRVAENNLMKLVDETSADSKLLEPIQKLLESRMKAMSSSQFAGMFMPMFEENKWLLIIVGMMLGAGVGFIQLVYLFGGSMVAAATGAPAL